MAMKQWDVFDYPYPSEVQPHPFVILSPNPLIESPDYAAINALMCVSVRGDYQIKFRDVRLDHNDGLDWETVTRCHFIHVLDKSRFLRRRGQVTPARRQQIARKIGECIGLGVF